MIGERHNRLVIIADLGRLPVGKQNAKLRFVRVRCDCGIEKKISLCAVRGGRTKSCGCLLAEHCRSVLRQRAITHGMSKSTEYNSWINMRQRCYRKNDKMFHHYGGRGIIVCERWLNSFADFYEDMGPKPSPAYTLDRLDNDGNYEPGNCRWATPSEQKWNTSVAIHLTLNGETMHVKEWTKRLGLSKNTIKERLRRGWTAEEALMQ